MTVIRNALLLALSGIIPASLFVLIFLATLKQRRQEILIEQEQRVISYLEDFDDEWDQMDAEDLEDALGFDVPPWLEDIDLASLETILDRTDSKLDELRDNFDSIGDEAEAWLSELDDNLHDFLDSVESEEELDFDDGFSSHIEDEPKSDESSDVLDRVDSYVESSMLEYEQIASQQAMESHGVEKYRFEAAPDACQKCLDDDGKVYDTKHEISHHPHCKCQAVPVIEEKEVTA